MVTGKEPHEDADQLEIALKIRDKGVTPEIPEDCDPVLRECMEMCWKFNPSDRPVSFTANRLILVLINNFISTEYRRGVCFHSFKNEYRDLNWLWSFAAIA